MNVVEIPLSYEDEETECNYTCLVLLYAQNYRL